MSVSLKLRQGVWQVVGTVTRHDGKRVRLRKTTGHTFHEKAWANKVMAAIVMEEAQKIDAPDDDTGVRTVGDVIRMHAARPDGVGYSCQRALSRFDRAFGYREVGDLTTLEVDRYFSTLGVGGSTIRRYMTSVKACFAYVKGKGVTVPDVKFDKPSDGDGRTRWLDVEERDRFIDAMPTQDSKDIVSFLFFTGARIGEAFALNHTDVMAGEVILRTRKGSSKKLRARRVPLHPRIRPMVERRATLKGALFTNQKKCGVRRWISKDLYEFTWPVIDALGIEDFRCHDMRHTFASHLVQNGATLKAVADLLGHMSLTMVMRYAHLGSSHLSSTVDLLDGGRVSSDTKLAHETSENVRSVEDVAVNHSELSVCNERIKRVDTNEIPLGIDMSKAMSQEKATALWRDSDDENTHPKNYTPDKE